MTDQVKPSIEIGSIELQSYQVVMEHLIKLCACHFPCLDGVSIPQLMVMFRNIHVREQS